jgi:drug/metabolite transporter (DMT)-like permease
MDEQESIRARLWNPEVDAQSYEGVGEKYRTAILEQYKLYVEMADRISARRALTNTFFLTLNTGLIAAAAATKSDFTASRLLLLVLIIAVGQCVAWWWLVRSYRLLNGAKYKVVGLLEERLPASPYWSAEWVALGEGKDWRKYLPITHLEQWVPVAFALVYVVGYLMLLGSAA